MTIELYTCIVKMNVSSYDDLVDMKIRLRHKAILRG